MKKSVLITHPLPDAARRILSRRFRVVQSRRPPSEGELRRSIRPFHGLLSCLSDPVTEAVLEAASRLECVSNYAVGTDNIDLEAARERGIWVTNTPGILTEATADIAWALILACARRIPEGEELVRGGKFRGWDPLLLRGQDLQGRTLGLFGFGRIGQAVARRGRGWGLRILYHQRKRVSRSLERALGARFVSFSRLLKGSDILSVNAPLTPATRHRFTRREFRAMGKHAIFINTARGAIHREKDLVEALKRGRIFAAGLDVFEFEPKVGRELRNLKNCVLLPHLGSATYGTRDRMAQMAASDLEAVLLGRKPENAVVAPSGTQNPHKVKL